MFAQESEFAALRDQLIGSELIGTANARYYPREVIGEGGQGWVYKANYDEPDGMWVVVKVLRPDSVTQETLTRFRREADVLRMLGGQASPNPNVVRFYDHGVATVPFFKEQVNMPFTVLVYVDGVTLAKLLEGPPRRSLGVERVRRVLRQVVRALETVHAHRVVHRDLKPSNILLTMQGNAEIAKVTDFGLVKLVDFKLTQSATVAGASLGYAPPEQYEQGNERVSSRTDVFSLAAILFEALAGREAFPYREGENPLRVISRLLTGPRPSLATHPQLIAGELAGQQDLIEQIDEQIGRATMSDPEQRHAGCRALWDAVEPLLREAKRRADQAGVRVPSARPPARSVPSVPAPARTASVQGGTVPGAGFGVQTVGSAAIEITRPLIRVVHGPAADSSFRAALVGGDGSMIAAGPSGFARWDGCGWQSLPQPAGLEARAVRGIARAQGGQILVYGDRGLLAALNANGLAEPLAEPMIDVNFYGAWCDDIGGVVAVGERLSHVCGVVAYATAHREVKLHRVQWSPRLRSVTCLVGGELIACGDAGALVTLNLPQCTQLPWARTGHLYCVAARPDGGASLVGSGGHALSVGPRMDVALEVVQTTRDLIATNIGADGAMWAVGAAGRILRRTNGVWERIGVEVPISSKFIALGPTDAGLLAVAEDGLVVDIRQER
jgi:eukaryotic-like serine/threonine-protein kinase